MEIFAIKGHKVTVTEESANNGYRIDKEIVAKNLKVGKIYTVEKTDVGQSSTTVYLQETPNIAYNSVNFEDVKSQNEELTKTHPHYKMWCE